LSVIIKFFSFLSSSSKFDYEDENDDEDDLHKQKAPAHGETGLQNLCARLIFPKLMMLELDLAPDIENAFNRLPWCQRASPSTTRNETVDISTDADRMMLYRETVKWKFPVSLALDHIEE